MSGSVPSVTRERFDAVLFDLDGVLTSTAAIHARAWKRMFDQYLREHHPNEPPFDIDSDYKKYVDGKPREDGVRDFLASRFRRPFLRLSAPGYRQFLLSLSDLGIAGGASYDALVAATAASHHAELMTCDRRAAPIYERYGVHVHLP